MGDDYDDYDERPQLPTFSDGSYTMRGSKTNAQESRMSASKNALAIASRASATMITSMQKLKNNTHPTNNTIRPVTTRPVTTQSAIRAAERRAQHLVNTIQQHETQQALKKPPEVFKEVDVCQPIYTPRQPVIIHEEVKIHPSDIYREIVNLAFIKKKLLLEAYRPTPPNIIKVYRNAKLVKRNTPTKPAVDPELLSILSNNLSNILNSEYHNNDEILNEIDRHLSRVRISVEEPLHKCAVDNALKIKASYFTSDT